LGARRGALPVHGHGDGENEGSGRRGPHRRRKGEAREEPGLTNRVRFRRHIPTNLLDVCDFRIDLGESFLAIVANQKMIF
jgi:hypothetical protein